MSTIAITKVGTTTVVKVKESTVVKQHLVINTKQDIELSAHNTLVFPNNDVLTNLAISVDNVENKLSATTTSGYLDALVTAGLFT